MATSGTPRLSRAWRVLVGVAFIIGLQQYFRGWWLDDGNERVLTAFVGAGVLALLTATSGSHAFWLWIGMMGAMLILLLEVVKSNLWPIALFVGGLIMGAGVTGGWALRRLVKFPGPRPRT